MKADVFLLKEGTRQDGLINGVNVSRAICSAVVLVRAGGVNVVVDPGAMGYGDEVLTALKKVGVCADDVSVIVNTHMHLDHTYNNYLFPKAVIYTPTSVWRSGDGNRVDIYPGMTDARIPGVKFMSTPGHTEKHISILVETDGGKVVIAGDAVREATIESGKKPRKYYDPDRYVQSMKDIFSVADEIIPGHGPKISGQRLKRLKEKLETLD